MSLTVGTIVKQVRSAIDEVMQNDSDFLRESNDELNLEKIIISKIGYALQYVLENAPLEKLDDSIRKTMSGAASGSGEDSMVKVQLPDDLLRILDARLSSWSRFPTPLSDQSQVALMQTDEYARGTWDRPVNILGYENGKRYLYMYSAKSAGDTANITYVPRPTLESYGEDDLTKQVSVPTQLEASLIYQIAALTMVAFREEVATSLFAIAQRYLDPEQQRNTDE